MCSWFDPSTGSGLTTSEVKQGRLREVRFTGQPHVFVVFDAQGRKSPYECASPGRLNGATLQGPAHQRFRPI